MHLCHTNEFFDVEKGRTVVRVVQNHWDEIERICSRGAYPWIVAEPQDPYVDGVLRELGWDGTIPGVFAIDSNIADCVARVSGIPDYMDTPPSRLRPRAIVSVCGGVWCTISTNGRLAIARGETGA